MAYHIYHTPGIIIGKTKVGEANELYTIFTRELGLISATAQGVRLQKSKLRASLQEYTIADFSIVRGKEMWRITNTREQYNIFFRLRDEDGKIRSVAKLFLRVRRFVTGEEATKDLYDVCGALIECVFSTDIRKEHLSDFDRLAFLHVLHNLGYGTKDIVVDELIAAPLNVDTVERVSSLRRHIDRAMERAVRESHL